MRAFFNFILIIVTIQLIPGRILHSQTRLAKVAVVSPYWDPEYRTSGHIIELLEKAGRHKPDLVCLPQDCIPTEGETIPGSISQRLGAVARKYKMYIAANIKERYKGKTYQTSFILDRSGRLAGKYRQTHKLHAEPIDLGNELPVFTTDFGKIALTIGSEIYVRELYQALRHKGSGLTIWSSSPELLSDKAYIDRLLRYRLNGYKVCVRYGGKRENPGGIAGFPAGNSMIVGEKGNILSQTGTEAGIAVALIPAPIQTSHIKQKNKIPSLYGASGSLKHLPTEKTFTKRKARISLLPCFDFKAVELAGKSQADLAICMTPSNPPVKNADLQALKTLAKKYQMYIALSRFINQYDPAETIIFDRKGMQARHYSPFGLRAEGKNIPQKEVIILDTDFCRLAWRMISGERSADIDRILAFHGVDMIIHPAIISPDHLQETRSAVHAADNGVYFAGIFASPDGKNDTRFYIVDRSGWQIRRSEFGERKIMTVDIDFDNTFPCYILNPALRYFRVWKYPDQWSPDEQPIIHSNIREVINRMRRPELYRCLEYPAISANN